MECQLPHPSAGVGLGWVSGGRADQWGGIKCPRLVAGRAQLPCSRICLQGEYRAICCPPGRARSGGGDQGAAQQRGFRPGGVLEQQQAGNPSRGRAGDATSSAGGADRRLLQRKPQGVDAGVGSGGRSFCLAISCGTTCVAAWHLMPAVAIVWASISSMQLMYACVICAPTAISA